MDNSLIDKVLETKIEENVQDVLGDTLEKLMQGVSSLAAKQGGETAFENYQLLAKRTLMIVGVSFVALQIVNGVVVPIINRKKEDERIEAIVRRVLAENEG